MSKRFGAAVTALMVAAGILAWALTRSSAQAPAAKEASGKDVFGMTKVWQFHVELTAKEWETMQKVSGGFGGKGPPKKDGDKPADKPVDKPADVHKSKGFGMEFPWARAALSVDGKIYKDVGIRYKGNFTYMASSGQLKRPLQIDLEHYGAELRFHALKKLNFGNGVTDPARLRETLAFAVFRAAGVPASRTAYAEVTLTVPGKYDKEYVGLYTLIEHVGNNFLKDHFKSAKGLLLKPEGLRSLDYLGEDWAIYEKRYNPKTEANKQQKQRLIAFTKLVNQADDDKFQKEIASYLDIDEFLRFVAVNGLLVNLDSFLGVGHNYYLYLRPDTNKFVFIPWDLDLSCANFPMGGTAQQQLDLSINHPHMGQNKLIDRLLALKAVNAQYQQILKELTSTCFTKEKLLTDIESIEKTTKALLAKEKTAVAARKEKSGGPGGFGGPKGGGPFGQSIALQQFVEKRAESVAEQLAGTRKGHVPTGGFGPPGGKGFGPGSMLAGPLLKAMDTNNDKKVSLEEMTAWAKGLCKDGKDLDEKTFAQVLAKLLPPPPKFGDKGPPPGFEPSAMFARQLLKKLDPKSEGSITQNKLIAELEKRFKAWDKDKNGTLDEAELTEGLNQLFGPPGFGPPPQLPAELPAFGDKKKEGPRR
jgi:spore coat protein CotH/Ca2+-binding EF-hand superfamily protein